LSSVWAPIIQAIIFERLSRSYPQICFPVCSSQIIHGVDRATSIGEQALKDIGAEMGQLILRIHEVSCDRDLWAHRFLAAKELQYSSALCAQALQLSQADFTIQAF